VFRAERLSRVERLVFRAKGESGRKCNDTRLLCNRVAYTKGSRCSDIKIF